MNERIRKLALQANANELSYAYYRGEKKPENAVTLHSVDLELFAELIVRELADIAKHHVMNISTYADADFVEKQIQEHFGVEE